MRSGFFCENNQQWRVHRAHGRERWCRSLRTPSPLSELPLPSAFQCLVLLGKLFVYARVFDQLFIYLMNYLFDFGFWLELWYVLGEYILLEVVWLVLPSKLLGLRPRIWLGNLLPLFHFQLLQRELEEWYKHKLLILCISFLFAIEWNINMCIRLLANYWPWSQSLHNNPLYYDPMLIIHVCFKGIAILYN